MIRRAIDVGYGHTKFTTSEMKRREGTIDIDVDAFQSIAFAPPTALGTATPTGSRTIVQVDGQAFCVAEQADEASSGDVSKSKGDNYVQSLAYRVFVGAAVKRMKVEHIDTLVLGTPVSNYRGAKLSLEQTFSAGIKFDSSTVHIEKFVVMPQPLGALYWHYYRRNQHEVMLRGGLRLVVDVGYGTLDWIVCKGGDPIASKAGSSKHGVSYFIELLTREILPDSMAIAPDMMLINQIDELITRDRELFYRGKTYAKSDFASLLDAQSFEAVRAAIGSIGEVGNIETVVLAGGGAGLYQSTIAKLIPHAKIEVVHASRFANVKGFQVAAEAQ
jgi:plasmid segregation protein ParM